MSDITILSDPAPSPTLLATVQELQGYLNYVPTGTASLDEVVAGEMLQHASKVFNRVRRFTPDPALDTDDPVTRDPIRLRDDRIVIPDVRSLTSVKIDGVEVSESRYELERLDEDEPYVYMEFLDRPHGRRVELTGYFGFAAVPDDVHTQVLVLAARGFYEKQSRHADVTQDPDGGGASYFRQLPKSTEMVRDAYKVPLIFR